jgi:hypothetical protein
MGNFTPSAFKFEKAINDEILVFVKSYVGRPDILLLKKENLEVVGI